MSRILDLAMAFVIFNLLAYAVTWTGIYPFTVFNLDEAFVTPEELEGQINSMNSDLDQQVKNNPITEAIDSVKLTITGIITFLGFLIKIPVALPFLMSELGTPDIIVYIMGIVMGFVYVIAAIQMYTGRTVRDDA